MLGRRERDGVVRGGQRQAKQSWSSGFITWPEAVPRGFSTPKTQWCDQLGVFSWRKATAYEVLATLPVREGDALREVAVRSTGRDRVQSDSSGGIESSQRVAVGAS